MADAFIGLARVALLQGDYVGMRRLSEESLSLARAGADRQARPLRFTTSSSRCDGRESLMIFRDMNSKRHMAYCFMGLGNVAAARGQPQLAGRFLGASDTPF